MRNLSPSEDITRSSWRCNRSDCNAVNANNAVDANVDLKMQIMKNIAILASGSGTNAENIARFFGEGNKIRVALVITNRKKAGVIGRMEGLGIDVEYVPNIVWDNDPQQVVELLRSRDIDLVVLAGFMHYVSPVILAAYPDRVVNIHPSLLPAYGGKGMWGHHVHEAVVAAGETESGVTVHYVTEVFDSGEIVMQQRVPVLPDDSPESLEERIHKAEYELYPRAIVAAIGRIPSEEEAGAAVESESAVEASAPPAVPKSVDEEWAEVLKVRYEPSEASVPPPVPGAGTGLPPQSQPQNMVAGQSVAAMPDREPMPPTFLLWSMLVTLCCCFIPGIAAIVFSSMVSTRYGRGDIEGAKRASRMAEIWIIVSFCLGVLTASLYVPLSLV